MKQLAATIVTLAAMLLFAGGLSAGSSSTIMAISDDGALMACSNRDNGSVTIIDLRTHKKLREIEVGHKPEGVTFLGPTRKLAVTLYHDDQVAFVDADSGKLLGRADVFDEPYGVVSSSDGKRVFVTLTYPGQVVEIDAASHSVVRTMDAGPFARGLAISNDDKRLYVTEYYTAKVLAIDVASGEVVDEWAGISSDNLSRQIVLHPTRDKAYLSHVRSATERAHGEGSIFPYVSVLDTSLRTAGKAAGDQGRRNRIPMDSFTGVYVTANPWDVAIAPDGKRFYIVFGGTNDMFACDVIDDDYRELTHRATVQLGSNPRAVAVSNDSSTVYVYNALDFEVVAYDADNLRRPVATVKVTENPLSEEVLLGKKLFYTAVQPMARRRWISCSSCHPDGESDARTWQNPEGLRDTPSLAGMAWTHPLHWSADRDEVQDFEHTIRGDLMQGKGLTPGGPRDYHESLGKPNKGLSRELDALAAYSNTHKFPLSPHAKGGLSDAAKRGREIFLSSKTACATCHSSPFYTDSRHGSRVLHDVGTGPPDIADPSEIMGSAYDTPTLLGIYRTAPYLHQGKAATLEEVLTKYNPRDRHGKTSHLTPQQISDLVEFLKSLPYEDPEPEAIKLGLPRVTN